MAEDAAWRPAACFHRIKARAALLAEIRSFFQRAGVLEVDTPTLSQAAATDPAIESLHTRYNGPGAPPGGMLYLHTSPEFAMKRLLAAGSGPIYQICKVFRDAERGRYHNPEFSLLEWYRPQFDHHRLMDEVEALLQSLLPAPRPVVRVSYRELFHRYLDIDPHDVTCASLRRLAGQQGIKGDLELSGTDAWLDLLLSHCIEPQLAGTGLCFVYDFPASQASLARINPGSPPLAARFELYLDGVELANGFHELGDADEQRLRFQTDLERRRRGNNALLPMDQRLLTALHSGLPDCSGVALGIDRLLMRMTDADHIDQVLAFPLERA